MAPRRNLLILIHGMVVESYPISMGPTYAELWASLVKSRPNLAKMVDTTVGVEWGHERPDSHKPLRPDELLTRAEAFVTRQASYKRLQASGDSNDVLMQGLLHADYGIPGLRAVAMHLKETTLISGLGDVIYYCSPDGERHVRSVVYEQVLQVLEAFAGDSELRLHLFGHSLGVTLCHDFLYGLFSRGHSPGFLRDPAINEDLRHRYRLWREKADRRQVIVGSLTCSASQLPLFHMRKQHLVEAFAQENLLDPLDIGIDGRGPIKWKLFYDVDDLLGFPTRHLYAPNDAIREIQVNSGNLPTTAHTGYWVNPTMIAEMAELIEQNC